jgi:hypothetical protein
MQKNLSPCPTVDPYFHELASFTSGNTLDTARVDPTLSHWDGVLAAFHVYLALSQRDRVARYQL